MGKPDQLDRDPSEKYDAILIGAGGAGMCLLLSMHESGWLRDKRLLVIEPDGKSQNDRTWCFWAKVEDPIVRSLEAIPMSNWGQAWAGGQNQPLDPYSYYHLRSADLYRYIKDLIVRYPEVQWLSAQADAVGETTSGVWVRAEGQIYWAGHVFDSRLRPEQLNNLQNGQTLWQSFVGWRIRQASPMDAPGAIRLMDFGIAQDEATQFIYVVPTSSCEALVEVTRFGVAPIEERRAEQLLSAWLEGRSSRYEVLERESGCIPMSQALNASAPQHPIEARIIPIGTAAGAVKASTGYALRRMFDHARGITTALIQGTPLPTPRTAPRFAFYDTLLLHLLIVRPALGKIIFERLFKRVCLKRVLTFLDEKSTVWQDISLLLSLPMRPFLQALFQIYTRAPYAWVSWPAKLQAGAATVGLAILAWIFQWIAPAALERIAPPLLLAGMIFPGIPHGALDHCLSMAGRLQGRRLWRFIATYVGIMALVLAIWKLSPLLGLGVFLLYSAWHFGETDLRDWGAFRPYLALIYGIALLAFLLAVHPTELEYYLRALGLDLPVQLSPVLLQATAAVGLAGIVGIGILTPPAGRRAWLHTAIVLLIGAWLPLIVAFGLYFIGLHSLRSWLHLRSGLQTTTPALLKMATPFSLGAFALFGGLLALDRLADLPFEGILPAMFVFLAAVSAPHIWFMHNFYQNARATGEKNSSPANYR
ncbi:MAG: beta-carotene 15,15'-dioxygenase, Brp/Blh family [Saprospiraceae bacterium]